MRLSELAKQHRNELVPTSKTSSVPLRFLLANGFLKILSRKKLEQLIKYAAKSCRIQQGLASFGCLVFSTKHLEDRQPFFGLFPVFHRETQFGQVCLGGGADKTR